MRLLLCVSVRTVTSPTSHPCNFFRAVDLQTENTWMGFVRSFICIFQLIFRGVLPRQWWDRKGERCCEEPRCRVWSVLSPRGARNHELCVRRSNRWDKYTGIPSWGISGAAGTLDFLQQIFRRCDCVSWSPGGPICCKFTVFRSQFVLPHFTVAESAVCPACCPRNTAGFS